MKGSRAGLQIISSWNQDALRVLARGAVSSEGWHHVFVTYDGSRKAKGVRIYYDGKPQSVYEEVDSLRGSIRTKTPLRLNRRSTGEGAGGEALHDVRFYRRVLTTSEVQVLARRVEMETALAEPPATRTPKMLAPLRDYYFAFVDADAMRLQQAWETSAAEFEAVKARSKVTLIAAERKGKPFARILTRGQYDQEGERVGAAVPAILPPLAKGAPANRLGLARWMTSPEHPLTARVNVNRFWAQVFGQGLVSTAGDFGTTGEPPIEPATARLARGGVPRVGMERQGALPADGDLRNVPPVRGGEPGEAGERRRQPPALPRAPLPDGWRDDPRPRPRGLRLCSSRDVGGPSVRPYQPPGIWETVAMEESNTKIYLADRGEAQLSPQPLHLLEARSPAAVAGDLQRAHARAVRRGGERTNTPLQALVTLNDAQFVEAARRLAEVAMRNAAMTPERLDAIALRVLSRPLAAAEQEAMTPVVRDLRGHYAADRKASKALVPLATRSRTRRSPRPSWRRGPWWQPVSEPRRGAQQVNPEDTFRVLLRRRRSGDDPARAPGPGRTGHRLGRARLDARRLAASSPAAPTARRTCRTSARGRVGPSGSFRPAPPRSSIPGDHKPQAARHVRQGAARIGPRRPAADRDDRSARRASQSRPASSPSPSTGRAARG